MQVEQWPAQKRRPMTYPDRMDRLFVRVHRLVQIYSKVPVEGEKMVQLSIASARP